MVVGYYVCIAFSAPEIRAVSQLAVLGNRANR